MDQFKNLVYENAKGIRNIYNQKEIVAFIEKIIERKNIQKENILMWLNNNLKNYILRDYNDIVLVEDLNSVTENWAILGIKNKTLHNVQLHHQFENQILHAIDYIDSEYKNKELSRLSIPEAIKQSIAWTENQKKENEDEAGRKVFLTLENGYYFVEMFSPQALKYEGTHMNHCLSKYHHREIRQKTKRAFSLRDKNNKPHVTILYDVFNNTIEEIKGNSNHEVKLEYQHYVADFLNNFSFEKIMDYLYIPNVSYTDNGFIAKETPRPDREAEFEFVKLVLRSFDINDNNVKNIDVKKEIKNSFYISVLSESSPEIIQYEFNSLILKFLSKYDEHILNQLNVKHLTMEKQTPTSKEFEELNNPYIQTLKWGKNKKVTTIKTIKLDNARYIELKGGASIYIDTLDLSQAKNLHTLDLSNIKITNLILPPHDIEIIKLNEVIIKNINELNAVDCDWKNINIENHEKINIKELKLFNASLDTSQISVSQLVISDKNYPLESTNKINYEEKIFNNPELLKEHFSPAWDGDYSMIKAYHYENTTQSQEVNMYELCKQMKDLCKEEYKEDIHVLLDKTNSYISYFKNIKFVDVSAIKYMFSLKGITNIYNKDKKFTITNTLKRGFCNYLIKNNQLAEYILFETLQLLNTKPFSLEDFSLLLKDAPSELIKEYTQKLTKSPDYRSLSYQEKVLQDEEEKDMNELQYRMKTEWTNQFKTDLFKKKINEIELNHNFEHQISKGKKQLSKITNKILEMKYPRNNIKEIGALLNSIENASIIIEEDQINTIANHLCHGIDLNDINGDFIEAKKLHDDVILYEIDHIISREKIIFTLTENNKDNLSANPKMRNK